eukprot:TRINITY_DN25625_c0_g1_i2.p1 TRINITY_DN25625_c0_g1~~TRINITY_DN25625_c0_g1_i2.p1  ORF type:complete len:200 (+),score=39.61 TRINITY_DN25625_c0_g1_i2:23-601(+)
MAASEADGKAQKRSLAAAAAEARLAGGSKPCLPVAENAPSSEDPPASQLFPVFDRAIAAATARTKRTGLDAHHAQALRKAKKAVTESVQRGDDLQLSALHSLKGVGHWVVSQLREHSTGGSGTGAGGDEKRRRVEAQPTPQSFSWWYISKAGKRVEERNDAEVGGLPGCEQFRVCILHSSGRMEKALGALHL